jgi:hypothetical protein
LVFGAIKLWKMLFIRLSLGNKTSTPPIFTSQTCRGSLAARFTWIKALILPKAVYTGH